MSISELNSFLNYTNPISKSINELGNTLSNIDTKQREKQIASLKSSLFDNPNANIDTSSLKPEDLLQVQAFQQQQQNAATQRDLREQQLEQSIFQTANAKREQNNNALKDWYDNNIAPKALGLLGSNNGAVVSIDQFLNGNVTEEQKSYAQRIFGGALTADIAADVKAAEDEQRLNIAIEQNARANTEHNTSQLNNTVEQYGKEYANDIRGMFSDPVVLRGMEQEGLTPSDIYIKARHGGKAPKDWNARAFNMAAGSWIGETTTKRDDAIFDRMLTSSEGNQANIKTQRLAEISEALRNGVPINEVLTIVPGSSYKEIREQKEAAKGTGLSTLRTEVSHLVDPKKYPGEHSDVQAQIKKAYDNGYSVEQIREAMNEARGSATKWYHNGLNIVDANLSGQFDSNAFENYINSLPPGGTK